jgi:hypothetical protein
MNQNSNPQNTTSGIRDDILTIVGGHFTPASLGPEAYQEILTRARAHAKEYIEEFESLFLGPNFDAINQSGLLLPLFLQLLADVEPERVKAVAERLLKQYNAVLAFHDAVTDRKALFQLLPDETVRLSQRLEDRRRELQELMK